jgi:hypothetical protein
MATDSTMGLFQTPEQYQLAQQQAQMEQARQFATMTPGQQVTAQLYQAGGQLGRALGGQDPQLQLATARRQIMQGVDQTDPKSLAQAAQALNQAGDVQGARALAQAAQEAALKQSQVTKNLREGNAAMLTTDQRNFKQAQDEGYKGNFNQWLNEQNSSKASKTNVSVDAKGETAFAQELGKLDAKKVNDAVDARQGAIGLIKAVNELDKLDNAGLVSGSFATGRVGVANFLNTAGLASPEEAKKLANSQSYQKVAGDVILGNLGGKLGAGVSEGDRKFVEGLVPQLETSPDARRQLIQYMRTKGMDVIKESSRLENYARQNKGLSGYQPEIPLKMPSTTPVTPVSATGNPLVDKYLVKPAGQ